MTQQEFFNRYTYSVSRDRIGGGGFGTVYKAYDNVLHREVAIKVSEVKTTADGKKTFSLKDEFEALDHVPKHPNIANYEEFYSFESPQGIFDYAVMQYYADGNLSNAIKQGLTMEQKEDIATQLLEGIDFLHKHKVVHRDLKPGNILIVKHGGKVIPLITDFGLSKTAGVVDGSVFSNSFGAGTPKYSSPEQLQGKPLRFNTDLWSYGAILYELFTGEQLFTAGSGAANTAQADMEIYNKIVNGNVQSLGKMPEKWRKVAERCLVVDAGKRAKDATELFEMIEDTAMTVNGDDVTVFDEKSNISRISKPECDRSSRESTYALSIEDTKKNGLWMVFFFTVILYCIGCFTSGWFGLDGIVEVSILLVPFAGGVAEIALFFCRPKRYKTLPWVIAIVLVFFLLLCFIPSNYSYGISIKNIIIVPLASAIPIVTLAVLLLKNNIGKNEVIEKQVNYGISQSEKPNKRKKPWIIVTIIGVTVLSIVGMKMKTKQDTELYGITCMEALEVVNDVVSHEDYDNIDVDTGKALLIGAFGDNPGQKKMLKKQVIRKIKHFHLSEYGLGPSQMQEIEGFIESVYHYVELRRIRRVMNYQ